MSFGKPHSQTRWPSSLFALRQTENILILLGFVKTVYKSCLNHDNNGQQRKSPAHNGCYHQDEFPLVPKSDWLQLGWAFGEFLSKTWVKRWLLFICSALSSISCNFSCPLTIFPMPVFSSWANKLTYSWAFLTLSILDKSEYFLAFSSMSVLNSLANFPSLVSEFLLVKSFSEDMSPKACLSG